MQMSGESCNSILIRALGNSLKLRVLDYLLDYKLNDFAKKEIVEALVKAREEPKKGETISLEEAARRLVFFLLKIQCHCL